MGNDLEAGPGGASPRCACSAAKRYKCDGGRGCKTPGCEFTAIGQPENTDETVYMCPFNHWRSCRWIEQPNKQHDRLEDKAHE